MTHYCKDLQYFHCDMNGHTIKRCFFLHDFPPKRKFHGKDVKPRKKEPTKSLLQEIKQLKVKEYDQLMTLLHKRTGNP